MPNTFAETEGGALPQEMPESRKWLLFWLTAAPVPVALGASILMVVLGPSSPLNGALFVAFCAAIILILVMEVYWYRDVLRLPMTSRNRMWATIAIGLGPLGTVAYCWKRVLKR